MKLAVVPHQADNLDAEKIVLEKKHPIFETFQGEGMYTGMSSLFVRLFGCNDTCSWCDTKNTWKIPQKDGGDVTSSYGVARKIARSNLDHVVITGGEPSLQAESLLRVFKYTEDTALKLYTLETNGSHFDQRLSDHISLASLSPKIHDFENDGVQGNIRQLVEVP